MADPKYKDDDIQRRAIVGDRHFVSAGTDDTWLVPGVRETGLIDEHGRRIFTKHRVITTAQLQVYARYNGQSVYINDRYRVYRPTKYEPLLKFE